MRNDLAGSTDLTEKTSTAVISESPGTPTGNIDAANLHRPENNAETSPQPLSLREIRNFFRDEFGENEAAATLTLLTMLSGGTQYALANMLIGPSSAGKTFVSQRVGSLLPAGAVCFSSRVSVAALFAMPRLRCLANDEFVRDPEFEKVRRQLISTGSAERYLATPTGELRHEIIKGPVAIVECALATISHDFQDTSRAICVPLNISPETIRGNSTRIIATRTDEALQRNACWEAFKKRIRSLAIVKAKCELEVVFDRSVHYLNLPHSGAQLPRRIQQVLAIASVIALLRQERIPLVSATDTVRGTVSMVSRRLGKSALR